MYFCFDGDDDGVESFAGVCRSGLVTLTNRTNRIKTKIHY